MRRFPITRFLQKIMRRPAISQTPPERILEVVEEKRLIGTGKRRSEICKALSWRFAFDISELDQVFKSLARRGFVRLRFPRSVVEANKLDDWFLEYPRQWPENKDAEFVLKVLKAEGIIGNRGKDVEHLYSQYCDLFDYDRGRMEQILEELNQKNLITLRILYNPWPEGWIIDHPSDDPRIPYHQIDVRYR